MVSHQWGFSAVLPDHIYEQNTCHNNYIYIVSPQCEVFEDLPDYVDVKNIYHNGYIAKSSPQVSLMLFQDYTYEFYLNVCKYMMQNTLWFFLQVKSVVITLNMVYFLYRISTLLWELQHYNYTHSFIKSQSIHVNSF